MSKSKMISAVRKAGFRVSAASSTIQRKVGSVWMHAGYIDELSIHEAHNDLGDFIAAGDMPLVYLG